MGQLSVERLAKTHPVLGLLTLGDEPGAYEATHVDEFVDYELRNNITGGIPYTQCDFYTDYVNFLVVRYLRLYRASYGARHFRWDIQKTLDQLAKLAYMGYVGKQHLSDNIVRKWLPEEMTQDQNTLLQGTKGAAAIIQDAAPLDMELRSFGLLEHEETTGHKIVFRFRENCVRDFLVARFFAMECTRKIKAARNNHKISSAMRAGMKKLPAYGDIWRMAFGILSKEPAAKDVVGEVLHDVIQEAKSLPDMSPFHITSFFVESVYEMQNPDCLADLLDEFTLNQTIRYSDQFMNASRMSYAMSAVGYLVRVTGDIYGVHMSQFGVGPDNISMLANPVNDISDNNLQVLNLSYNPLGSQGMKGLLRFLVKATRLTHLDLSSCELGNMGVYLLSEFFMCMPLRYLRLTENGIGDVGLRRMVPNLHYMPTLEWLDMAENEITDKSAVLLGQSLPNLPNLRSLDVRRNKIGDAGVESISRNLAQLNQVTQLMLEGNLIGEQGATCMSAHIWKTKSLRFVNLSLNNIPAAGILGLRRAASSHGSLKIQVSGRNQEVGDFLDISTAVSDGEFIITPEEKAERDMENGGADLSVWSGGDSPRKNNLSASVDLLEGRDGDFSLKRVGRRSGQRKSSFRQSWHGGSTSLRDSFYRKNRDRDSMPVNY